MGGHFSCKMTNPKDCCWQNLFWLTISPSCKAVTYSYKKGRSARFLSFSTIQLPGRSSQRGTFVMYFFTCTPQVSSSTGGGTSWTFENFSNLKTGTSWTVEKSVYGGNFSERTPPARPLKPTVALSQAAEAFSNKLEFSLMRQFQLQRNATLAKISTLASKRPSKIYLKWILKIFSHKLKAMRRQKQLLLWTIFYLWLVIVLLFDNYSPGQKYKMHLEWTITQEVPSLLVHGRPNKIPHWWSHLHGSQTCKDCYYHTLHYLPPSPHLQVSLGKKWLLSLKCYLACTIFTTKVHPQKLHPFTLYWYCDFL